MVILQDFQESLAKSFRDQEDERDQFFGTPVENRRSRHWKLTVGRPLPPRVDT
jgi:hypothetical protein